MQNQNQFKTYLNANQWDNANEWLQKELNIIDSMLVRKKVSYNAFGILMSVVMAFFTWVILFPSADEKELAAFPLTTLSNNLFNQLYKTVQGGKVTVILGLTLIPFLVGLLLNVIFKSYKSKKYAKSRNEKTRLKKILGFLFFPFLISMLFYKSEEYTKELKGKTKAQKSEEIKEKIKLLSKLRQKYNDTPFIIFFYTFFAFILTGGVMTVCAVPGGLNPFEYLFVGIICGVVYGIIFFCCSCFVMSIQKVIKDYPIYDWEKIIDSKFKSKKTDTYVPSSRIQETLYFKHKVKEYMAEMKGIPYEDEEKKKIKEILDDVDDYYFGGGWGNY